MGKILLAGILLLGACGPSMQTGTAEPVTLRVTPTTVAPGGSLQLILRNESESEVGYNLCASALERRSGDGWEAVASDRVCTMELRVLPVGDEATHALDVPSDLQPGEYRVVANVEMTEAGQTAPLRSAPFQVTS